MRMACNNILYSIIGTAKTIEQAQTMGKNMLPVKDEDGPQRYRAAYIVHLRDQTNDITEESADNNRPLNTVIGLISVQQCQIYGTPFPDHLTLPDVEASADSVLKMEMGYMFLPQVWGKGYGTETVVALLQAYKTATDFWKPYKGVYMHVVVGEDNPASCRIVEKAGMKRLGIHEWEGKPVFLAGAWRECRVLVFGMYLVKPDTSAK
jgi:RimJ/RimL family protein N-acetyltransferase